MNPVANVPTKHEHGGVSRRRVCTVCVCICVHRFEYVNFTIRIKSNVCTEYTACATIGGFEHSNMKPKENRTPSLLSSSVYRIVSYRSV